MFTLSDEYHSMATGIQQVLPVCAARLGWLPVRATFYRSLNLQKYAITLVDIAYSITAGCDVDRKHRNFIRGGLFFFCNIATKTSAIFFFFFYRPGEKMGVVVHTILARCCVEPICADWNSLYLWGMAIYWAMFTRAFAFDEPPGTTV